MSSQDSLNSAQSEEEKAKILQNEIEKEQASVTAMQHRLSSEDPADADSLQRDIESKSQIIASLQQKYEMHAKDAERLRQQAMAEQQQEQRHQQQEDEEGPIEKGAKRAIKKGLFG